MLLGAGQFGLPQCGPQGWTDIATSRPSPQCGPTCPTAEDCSEAVLPEGNSFKRIRGERLSYHT